MANYIDKNILCQAYLHLENVPLNEGEVALFKEKLNKFVDERGRFFIYEEVTPEVDLKDGSLKVYATVLGSLYLAISQYGSFRSGIDYLVSDVKRLSETFLSESLFQSKCRHDNIIRIEARVGVAGRIKQVIDDIDYIASKNGSVEPSTILNKLEKVQYNLEKIFSNLNTEEDRAYVKKSLKSIAQECLPSDPKPKPKETVSREMIAIYRERRNNLVTYLS